MKNSFKYYSIVLLSILTIVLSSCSTYDDQTWKGAGVGAAVGGVAGAILGERHDKPLTGAVLGAAGGATLGGYQGNQIEKQKRANQELRQRINRLEQQQRGY